MRSYRPAPITSAASSSISSCITTRTASRIRSTPSPARNASRSSGRADSSRAIGVFSFGGFLRNTPRITPMAHLTADLPNPTTPRDSYGLGRSIRGVPGVCNRSARTANAALFTESCGSQSNRLELSASAVSAEVPSGDRPAHSALANLLRRARQRSRPHASTSSQDETSGRLLRSLLPTFREPAEPAA